jgi:hypothetical protein
MLTAQIGERTTGRLVALGNHAFVLQEYPEVRITFAVSGDRATKLTLARPGGTFEASRAP